MKKTITSLQVIKNWVLHHRFIIGMAMSVFVFVVAAGGLVVVNGETLEPGDTRVVRVYVDGEETTIPIRAENVGDVLKKLNITLRDSDEVEPSLDARILSDDFQINVYRAKPVTVIDGSRRIQILTPHQSPRRIADEAGVKVYPEDRVRFSETTDFIKDGVIGQMVTIERSTPVIINLYGTLINHRTLSTKVTDVLREKGITLAPDDTLSPAADSLISSNMMISVSRFGTQVVTVEEEIPFTSEQTTDPESPIGKVVVTRAGTVGKRIVTYEITLKNGQEESRREIQSVVAIEPTVQQEVRGTKVVDLSSNVVLGQQIAAELGLSDQFECIYQIFWHESKWNHLAQNGSSGAYGIPQALPGSKMGPGWDYDPAVQIRWGINYMNSRYGGPCQAWSFWQTNRWY